ncbi:hypothetical protein [Brachyspira pilosicoli]|uniref:hypothetical protein n=1 Tax=Brachyspira pilosicoli TaxID=52584 RepID=UPI003006F470
MEKKYICYIYNLILGNEKIFLFGFVIKYNNFCFLDKLPTFNDSEIEISFSILDENEYNEFINKCINDNIFSFNLLKQNGNDINIKYISDIKLNKPKNSYSFISLHKFKKLFINNHDFDNIDITNIVEKLKKYAHPFFDNNYTPIGSFYVMENNIVFYDNQIKVNIDIYSSKVNLLFDNSMLNNTARLIIYSDNNEIIFDSIISIDSLDKNITASTIPTGYSLEIFDETGESIYYKNYHLLLEMDLKINILENELTINDILSKKNKELNKISLKDNPIDSKISYIEKINDIKLKDYITYYKYIRDKLINNRYDHTKFNRVKSYWFEKINNTECINKIIELVKEANEAIFIDPYFDAFDDLNDKNMNSTQNMMVLLNRLVGNITIITTSKNTKYLSSQLSNICKLFELKRTNIILKTINNFKMHDRYLLLKKENDVILYSLTNSINSVMGEYPLGIFYVNIFENNNNLKEYIYNIVNSATESFNMINVIKNNKSIICKNKYISYLIDDIENNTTDEVFIEDENSFIEKYNKLKTNDEIIAFLALSATLTNTNEKNYPMLTDIFYKDIELISDKTELLIKMEKYLFDNHYKKSGIILTYSNSLLDIIKKDELSIENYVKISIEYENTINHIPICNWEIFLDGIYRIDPDSIVNYIKKSSINAGELQIRAFNLIINKYYYLNENSNVNTNFIKMLLMKKIINSIDKTNGLDIDLIEEKINILKNLGIPNSTIFLAFLYSHIFFENGRTEFNETIDDFIKLDIFKNIINKSNISEVIKVLKNNNILNLKILNKIINSDLVENNDTDIKIKLLNMYFEHNTNIRNIIFNDFYYIYQLVILLSSFDNYKDVFKILNNLLKINNISNIDDELLCIPIFDKINNQYFNTNYLKEKVCIILYLFTEIIEDSKVFIDKVITIYLNIHSGFIYTSELIKFLMLKGVFNYYYCDKATNINNNAFKQFLEELKKDNNLKVIYDIFNDYNNYSYDSLKVLFEYIYTISKKNNINNIEQHLINIVVEIIRLIFNSQIKDQNEFQAEFDKLIDIVSNIIKDIWK